MDLAHTFKALGDPTRLRILAAVAEEELTVGEIREVVGSVQSAVSRNLAILRDAGFVADRREGTNVYFSLRRDMDEAARRLFDSAAPRFADLPEAKEDRRRLRRCLERRARRSRGYFESVAGDWERIRKSCFDDRLGSVALEKLVPRGLIVADIGCGTGSLTFELARVAKNVVGIDLSPEMLKRAQSLARERGVKNVEFRRGDAERIPLDVSSVDAAFCVMVLHFLKDPARAVRELVGITRPGGPVVLLDLVPHQQEWMRDEMAHRWLGFDQKTIEEWFRAAGCGEIEFELTGSYAGEKAKRNGKRAVEIFVARAIAPRQDMAEVKS
jgi:ArsR family transcriptional regulator